MAVGPLMTEHRLIEKLIPQIRKAVEDARRTGAIDPAFVEFAVDFVRTYADRCHHGKEEDILFRELDRKPLEGGLRKTMEELIEEHRTGRRVVGELRRAVDAYERGGERDKGERQGAREGKREKENAGALETVLEKLEFLAEFYPAHIRKEDDGFFLPCMDYLDDEEQAAMLEEMREFDRSLVHEVYREKMENWAERLDVDWGRTSAS